MRGQELYLQDVLTSIQNIREFVGSMTNDEFHRDAKTQSAVTHQFQIIGEAIKHFSPELKSQHPEINWKDISGMRDILIHEYFGIDVELLWETVKQDLMPLESAVKKLLVSLKK